jgi:hypothetical protein
MRRREFIAGLGGVAVWPLGCACPTTDAGDRISECGRRCGAPGLERRRNFSLRLRLSDKACIRRVFENA